MKLGAIVLTGLISTSWATSDGHADKLPDSNTSGTSANFERANIVNAGVPSVIKARKIAGVGVAIIRNFHVVWTHYYGEQGPGVPASRDTMFNTASVAKSITTETVLRLVAQGKVSLDESIAEYYVESDLASDPRYKLLTPRLILSHRSGLLNWSYNYENKKLAFVADPGTRFGYSGAAFDILAKFLERKLHTDFETLVGNVVLTPIGMSGVSMRRRPSIDARVTTPMDSSGKYGVPYTSTQPDWHDGSWSAASDLFITVDDYAKFAISVMKGEGTTPTLARERWRVESSFVGAPEWECVPQPSVTCPDPYGFGLGWLVLDYGGKKFVWATGNDSGENALAYFYPNTPGEAVIVFINGGNGVVAMPDIVDLIDPNQKWSQYIRELIDRLSHK